MSTQEYGDFPVSPDGNSNNFDKTFVEGSDSKTGYHAFKTGVRVDRTAVSATNPYGGTQPASSPIADTLPTGSEPIPLGSGTIVGLLGAGGMARVYKIWNEKLEVFRAVKILIPTQQGDLHNRFETEAKITAKLRHSNIVEVYSVGDWKGLPYLEMELIDGSSLDNMIHTIGKLPPAACSAIAIFVTRALSYAHNQEFLLYGKTYQGIIHRDLKPANIMISKHGDLRLMDFGIARPTEASLHTVEGNIVGTMQYLSPEQLDGVDIDARADLYSFGAILYEMITGTKTFPQDTITNLMKRKIMNDYRKFEEFDFNVPNGLAKIAQKCLQLDKKNRYANANQLLEDLEEAHKALTSDTPETVLKSYLSNPSSISTKISNSTFSRIPFKIVIPAAAVAILGGIITAVLVSGSAPDRKTTIAKPPLIAVTKPITQPIPIQPAQPEPVQTTPVQAEPIAPSEPQTYRDQLPEQLSSNHKSNRQIPTQVKSGKSNQKEMVQEKEIVSERSSSPLESLKKSYNATNYVEIGQAAMAKNAFDDAILALETVENNSPQHDKATILLIEAYLEADKLRNAKLKIQEETINDAQFCLLSGEVYLKMGRTKEAVESFQTALTKPSKYKNIADVRNDALFYTAMSYSEIYKDNPSPDNRGIVLQSWRVVKNMYANNPNSNRFKKAVSELSSIN